MTRLDELIHTTPIHESVLVGRDLLVSLRAALAWRPEVTSELAQTIARAIAYSAGVVLVQREVPQAAQLSGELGNNCAQHVVLILETFLRDGILPHP